MRLPILSLRTLQVLSSRYKPYGVERSESYGLQIIVLQTKLGDGGVRLRARLAGEGARPHSFADSSVRATQPDPSLRSG